MNYDEITKITAERISDYMTEAVNTDSIAVAEMFHNAAWGVRTLWFELVTKIDIDIHKKNRYASYDLSEKRRKPSPNAGGDIRRKARRALRQATPAYSD